MLKMFWTIVTMKMKSHLFLWLWVASSILQLQRNAASSSEAEERCLARLLALSFFKVDSNTSYSFISKFNKYEQLCSARSKAYSAQYLFSNSKPKEYPSQLEYLGKAPPENSPSLQDLHLRVFLKGTHSSSLVFLFTSLWQISSPLTSPVILWVYTNF